MNYIELFAGCGGLSLGLESAGFELLLANELSPMAAESFAFNILGIDLTDESEVNLDKVKWISSQHKRTELALRLRENPYTASLQGEESDLDSVTTKPHLLRGNLLVGSLVDLNSKLRNSSKIRAAFQSGFGEGGVDLVSGGPPCQSFSMAGLRQLSNPRNSLPWAFAEFVQVVQPKIVLLENVSGILHAFQSGGKRYHAWYEVAKAFATEGYVPLCLHVNAKYAGAAQNRPRFILLAFREDIASAMTSKRMDQHMRSAIQNSFSFYSLVHDEHQDPEYGDLMCHHIEKDLGGVYKSPLLAPLIEYRKKQFTVKDAIHDLNGAKARRSKYVNLINSTFVVNFGKNNRNLENHDPRSNSKRVQARFRLYQVMGKIDRKISREISEFIRMCDTNALSKREVLKLGKQVSDNTISVLNEPSNWLLSLDGKEFSPGNRTETLEFLSLLHTKKQTQRVLDPNLPAPAALSIPDDACHYHETVDQRTLTVREMARFQSFPDWFEFRSKVTTGGQMRKFEVPQYTQVGNAVPPMLGRALGKVCKGFLELMRA